MDTAIDFKLTSLAKLDKTPDEILGEKRAVLETQLNQLRRKKNSRFHRLVAWRVQAVEQIEVGYVVWSIMFRGVQCVVLAKQAISAESHSYLWLVFLLTVIFGVSLHAMSGGLKFVWQHLLRTLIFPLMPFVHIFDILASSMLSRDSGDVACTIRSVEMELAKLTAPTIVPAYYADGIEQARRALLGTNSELRRTEHDLRLRLEELRSQTERLKARHAQASGNMERASILERAVVRAIAREGRLAETLRRVETTIAKTNAILDECSNRIAQLREPLEDEELIQEIEAGEAKDEATLTAASDAILRHVERVRSRLFELATAISAPPALPLNAHENLESYFTAVERYAEKVEALSDSQA